MTLSVITPAATQPLSPNLQAVLLSKILLYERQYRLRDDIKVFVVDDRKIALAFTKLIGGSDEWVKITQVDSGAAVPEQKYDLIYAWNEHGEMPCLTQLSADSMDTLNTHRRVQASDGKIGGAWCSREGHF